MAYEERSVDNAEFRRQLVEDYKRMATPTIVCGEEIIVGFDREKIDTLFSRLAGEAPSA
jgi:arsenate reductase-like glutaredoxin family protein